MNIVKVLKSFDIFNSEAIRFLKEKAVNIFLLETPSDLQKGIDIYTDLNSVNINVINKPKMYNLMVSAQRRIQEKKLKKGQSV